MNMLKEIQIDYRCIIYNPYKNQATEIKISNSETKLAKIKKGGGKDVSPYLTHT